ncbi:MAG: ABC transporter ATP-binding protein [Clostridium sp.]|nr:ABC transporter ATP-binding protein [Clostridium sp.]
MSSKLEVQGLSYSYHSMDGETKALSDISFQAEEGEFLAVVGPSGCGKSTLLSILCGLLVPENGSVLIDGEPVRGSSPRIGYMLQRDHLFEWRDVFSNACLGLEIRGQMDRKHREKVERLLEAYGLFPFKNKRPSELSGGMRQRAALIRTLALDPDILLLDEPFSALDYQTRLAVCDDISSIIRENKKTAILITHDLAEAVSTADRILILTRRPGKIKAVLPVVFSEPDLSPLRRRSTPEFPLYFNEVWRILENREVSHESS